MFKRRNLADSTRRRVFSPVGPTDWSTLDSPGQRIVKAAQRARAGTVAAIR